MLSIDIHVHVPSLPSRRLLPVQTNVDDHDPANCSLYVEIGGGGDVGGFNPANGQVNFTDGLVCPPAEFTPAAPGVSCT